MKIQGMKTLDDVKVKGKKILIRVDLNASIINNKVQKGPRFRRHSATIKELLKKGAKVVVLAHQKRKDNPEYRESLEEHAAILSELIGKKVHYVDDLFGDKAVQAIKKMKAKEVILLKNTRSYKGEVLKKTAKQHSRCKFVKTIAPLCDIFVQDALSVCHRSHASVIGFPYIMPCYVGKVLEKELDSIEKANKKLERPLTLILGGAKIGDYFSLIKRYVEEEKVDYILTTGVLSLVAMAVKGINMGKQNKILKDQGLLKNEKEIQRYLYKFSFPKDFAVEFKGKREEISIEDLPTDFQLLDIGKETVEKYKEIIKKSKTIFVKGSAGNYERKGFDYGTKQLLKEVGKSKAFSIAGGGETTTAVERYKISGISHISLSGGGLLQALSGKDLPGVEVLKNKEGKLRGGK
jgi:phosphoglycerate kinase